MLHHRPRVAGLLAILASLVLVPGALAATPSKAPTAAKAKERAYGKYCGPKRAAAARTAARAKCLDAMSQIASGATTSPRKACRALKRKRAKGERKSAFVRCVAGAKRLINATDRGAPEAGDAGDGPALDDGAGADGADGADDPDAAGDPDDADLDNAGVDEPDAPDTDDGAPDAGDDDAEL